jgi:hypothetical protein
VLTALGQGGATMTRDRRPPGTAASSGNTGPWSASGGATVLLGVHSVAIPPAWRLAWVSMR